MPVVRILPSTQRASSAYPHAYAGQVVLHAEAGYAAVDCYGAKTAWQPCKV